MAPLMILPENASSSTINSYLTPTMTFLIEKELIQIPEGNAIIVNQVFPDSMASGMGMLSGDVILEINNTPIDSINLQSILQDYIGEDVVLQVQR